MKIKKFNDSYSFLYYLTKNSEYIRFETYWFMGLDLSPDYSIPSKIKFNDDLLNQALFQWCYDFNVAYSHELGDNKEFELKISAEEDSLICEIVNNIGVYVEYNTELEDKIANCNTNFVSKLLGISKQQSEENYYVIIEMEAIDSCYKDYTVKVDEIKLFKISDPDIEIELKQDDQLKLANELTEEIFKFSIYGNDYSRKMTLGYDGQAYVTEYVLSEGAEFNLESLKNDGKKYVIEIV